jgi:hypothetical protein
MRGEDWIMRNRLRRHDREQIDRAVQVEWPGDTGIVCFARCRCIDISQSGMRLNSPEPMPVRTSVNFQIEGTAFNGCAWVRSCVRSGLRYLIGMEFGGGLRWKPTVEQESSGTKLVTTESRGCG